MGEILPFRKRSLKEKHRGKTLCRHGHHKWVVEKESQFDVKQGRLVTVYRCQRCDRRRVEAH
jgi:predicted metal-binding protein